MRRFAWVNVALMRSVGLFVLQCATGIRVPLFYISVSRFEADLPHWCISSTSAGSSCWIGSKVYVDAGGLIVFHGKRINRHVTIAVNQAFDRLVQQNQRDVDLQRF